MPYRKHREEHHERAEHQGEVGANRQELHLVEAVGNEVHELRGRDNERDDVDGRDRDDVDGRDRDDVDGRDRDDVDGRDGDDVDGRDRDA